MGIGPCARGDYRQKDANGPQVEVGKFYGGCIDGTVLCFIKRWVDSRDEIYADCLRLNPFGNPFEFEAFILGKGQYLPPGIDQGFPTIPSGNLKPVDPEVFIQKLRAQVGRLERWVNAREEQKGKE